MAKITLNDVSVEFPIYQGSSRSIKKTLLRAGTGGRINRDSGNRISVRALDRLSLSLEHGDRVALVGPNGSGKTTLLRVLAGVYEPVAGAIQVEGSVSPLFDVGVGFNPDATGYENILLRGLYMGLPPEQVRARVDEIADFSELGDYLAVPVRTYSAGMMLRLSFGVATCVDPDILLMDEWVLAGDAHFFGKARQRLKAFIERSSLMVLASHADDIVRQWCNKGVLLEHGQVRAVGPIDEVLALYHGERERTMSTVGGLNRPGAGGEGEGETPAAPADVEAFWLTLPMQRQREIAAEFGYAGSMEEGRFLAFLRDTDQLEGLFWRVRSMAATPAIPEDVARSWDGLAADKRRELADRYGYVVEDHAETGPVDSLFLRHLKGSGQLSQFFDQVRALNGGAGAVSLAD